MSNPSRSAVPPDYAASAQANRWAASQHRRQGDERAAQIHDDMADLYEVSAFKADAALDAAGGDDDV